MKDIKLHLGCGKRKIHGFINIDVDPQVNPDMVMPIHDLVSFKSQSVSLIYACHVLEHFDIFQTEHVLKNWYNVLKPGGILRLSVPDFDIVCKMYNSGLIDIRQAKSYLYGGQKNDWDYHKNCWDFESLKETLINLGFEDIKKYDWKKTEHFYIDDYSQAYVPHMDKNNGTLMSLNIEAKKRG